MKEKERKGKEMKANELLFPFTNFSESGLFNALRVKKIKNPRSPNFLQMNAPNAWLTSSGCDSGSISSTERFVA
jgi:hypothetical protein